MTPITQHRKIVRIGMDHRNEASEADADELVTE